jgi:hypothetical protein
MIGTRRRLAIVAAGFVGLIAADGSPAHTAVGSPLDSQYVLQRYAIAVQAVPAPKNVVFTYSVSQAGPANIEQRHQIFRNGSNVRDELLAVDGLALSRKRVTFARRENRYAIDRLAPKTDAAQVLFLESEKIGHRYDYSYEVTPLERQSGVYVDRMTIDGTTFLPRRLHFHTAAGEARGTGEVVYAPFGKYWMPVMASIDATVGTHPARERITWGDYRFPETLPSSTFKAPKPLPAASGTE